MAVSGSGWFGITLRDVLDSTQLGLDLTVTTHKVAMITNSATPNFDTHDHWADLSANEVSGTGYTAGGQLLDDSTPTLTVSSGVLVWDGPDISWAASTISSARAAVVYADSLTSDPLILLSDFGGDFATNSGTFTIQWSANGIGRLDF